jgi:hypothetical protein
MMSYNINVFSDNINKWSLGHAEGPEELGIDIFDARSDAINFVKYAFGSRMTICVFGFFKPN